MPKIYVFGSIKWSMLERIRLLTLLQLPCVVTLFSRMSKMALKWRYAFITRYQCRVRFFDEFAQWEALLISRMC